MTLSSAAVADLLAAATDADRLAYLQGQGLADETGLSWVLDRVEELVHEDPGAAEELAELCTTAAAAWALDTVAARARYLLARIHAERGELDQALTLIEQARPGAAHRPGPHAGPRRPGPARRGGEGGRGADRRARRARPARRRRGGGRAAVLAARRRVGERRGVLRLHRPARTGAFRLRPRRGRLPGARDAEGNRPAARQPRHRAARAGPRPRGPGRASLGGDRVRRGRRPAVGGEVPGPRRPGAPAAG